MRSETQTAAAPWCWMCDATGTPRAAEHVFPQWLLARLGAAGHTFAGGVRAAELTVPEVCAVCNTGWMSALEVAFRSVAFEQPRRGPIADTTQLILARWFAKTAVLVHAAAGSADRIQDADRHALRRGLPATFTVHLARSSAAGSRIERAVRAEDVASAAIRLGELVGVVHHSPPGPAPRPSRPLLRVAPVQRRRIAWDQLPSVGSLAETLRLRA